LGAWEFLNSTGVEWSGFNFNFANNDSDDELTKNYVKQMNRLAGEVYDLGGIEALAKIAQFERVFTRLAAQTRIYDYCGAEKSLLQLDTKGGVYGCNWF